MFAVNTFKPWSTPVSDEFDIYVDSNGDGVDDYVVFNGDLGLLQKQPFSGTEVVAVFNLVTGDGEVNFLSQAATDSSTMLLPVTADSIGVSTTNPRFTYHVVSFDTLGDGSDEVPGKASYNAFSPAITTGQFATVAPNATVSVPMAINRSEAAITPPLGYMIVTQDNKNGSHEAKLIKIKF